VTKRTAVYTDGACSGNPGPGGWAWIVPDGPFGAGPSPDTTNQRMELQAALEAVRALDGPLEIISDSTYVVKCFQDGWWQGWLRRGWTNSQRKPVANRDLWEPLIELYQGKDIKFTWVKGHAGDEWNDYADRLAVEATWTQKLRTGSEPPEHVGAPDDVFKRAPLGTVGRDPTGRQPPEGHRLVVLGLRPRELGGYGSSEIPDILRRHLSELISAKSELHDDLVVLSGLRLGTEMLAAEAAIEVDVPLVVVLPYPDPDSVWPHHERERFAALCEQAQEVVTLQNKSPKDNKAARGALARRDAWFGRHSQEAIVVWDDADDEVGRVVRSMQDSIGELDVWVLDPSGL
jgi:ribonuclease HI/uncharacterized phage-like protein YoqJ